MEEKDVIGTMGDIPSQEMHTTTTIPKESLAMDECSLDPLALKSEEPTGRLRLSQNGEAELSSRPVFIKAEDEIKTEQEEFIQEYNGEGELSSRPVSVKAEEEIKTEPEEFIQEYKHEAEVSLPSGQNVKSNDGENPETNLIEERQSEEDDLTEERETQHEDDSSLLPSRHTTSVLPAPTKMRRSVQGKADHVLDLVAKRMEAPPNSEFDVFGMYVAKRLQSLHLANPRMYSVVKKLINDAIFEGEMGTLTPSSRIAQNQAPSLSSTPVPTPSPSHYQVPSLSTTPVPTPSPSHYQAPSLSSTPVPTPSPSADYNYET